MIRTEITAQQNVAMADNFYKDLSWTVTNDERLNLIFDRFSPIFGTGPYNSSDMELSSPIGDGVKDQLFDYIVSLPVEEGQALFKSSRTLAHLSENEASHRALEDMYCGPRDEEYGQERLWTELILRNNHTSMSVRNRLRIVKSTLHNYLEETDLEGERKRIVLGIASGSSRGLLQVVSDRAKSDLNGVELHTMDISRDALQDTLKLAETMGVASKVKAIRANFLKPLAYLQAEGGYDFVEIVGLLDYFKNNEIALLLSEVKKALVKGGTVIYSNVTHNDEEQFTHQVVGWRPMHYRTGDEMVDFATKAGFERDFVKLVREPLGMCSMVVARSY